MSAFSTAAFSVEDAGAGPGERPTPESPLRVAFLLRSWGLGGAERQLIALLRSIDPMRVSASVLVFYRGGSLEEEAASIPGVTMLHMSKRSRWDVKGPLAQARARLAALRPDIVHGYQGWTNVAAVWLARSCGAKAVWGVRNSRVDYRRYDALWRLEYWAQRSCVHLADLVIANSEAGLNQFGTTPNGAVIPNGIDTKRFRPCAELRDTGRADLGVHAGQRLIGIVGRLDPMKGHDIFVRAAARLAHDDGTLRFVCVAVGEDEKRRNLERLAHELGVAEKIAFLSGYDDMPALYNALDSLVSCSVFGEGFPNVVGEALSCGTECVVSDVGGSAHVVGDLGTVVPPGDIELLVRALRGPGRTDQALRELRHRRVAEHYGTEALAERTTRALACVAGRSV